MMGFPSLADLDDGDSEPSDEPVKQTLFGFPAQKSQAPADDDADDEDIETDDYGATSIIPPSKLNFDNDIDLRGTVAGRPVVRPPRHDDEDEEDKTEIVSGSAVFAASGTSADDDRGHSGTLMGMSLEELEARQEPAPAADESEVEELPRATAFAIPAVQESPAPATDDLEEPSEEEVEDSPTMAWNPADDVKGKFDPDGRKKLLEKIRKSKPANRETSRGIPAASGGDSSGTQRGMAPVDGPDLDALRKLRPKRELVPTPPEFPVEEDERDTAEQEAAPQSDTPAQGVLRVPKRSSRPQAPAEGKVPSSPSSYMFGPGEAPAPDTKPPESKGVPIASIRPVPAASRPDEGDELGESISDPDFAYAETGVASGDLLAEAGFSSNNMPVQAPDATMPDDVLDDVTLQKPTRSPMLSPHNQPIPSAAAPTPFGQPNDVYKPSQPSQPRPQPQQQYTPPSQDVHEQLETAPFRSQAPGVYQTFEGQRQPQVTPGLPINASPQVRTEQPFAKKTLPPQAEDPIVARIQTLFGVLAGVITLIVNILVLFGGLPQETSATLLVAFALTLGVAAMVFALIPVTTNLRSVALAGVGALLLLCFAAGFVVTVPNTFLVLALGAFVAFMSAGFPSIARLLL